MQQSLLFCLFFLSLGVVASAQRPDYLKKDSIQSALDGHTQVFYYDKSTASTPQPLVVELHSWSNSADSQKGMIATQVHAKNWNFIFPLLIVFVPVIYSFWLFAFGKSAQ